MFKMEKVLDAIGVVGGEGPLEDSLLHTRTVIQNLIDSEFLDGRFSKKMTSCSLHAFLWLQCIHSLKAPIFCFTLCGT